MPGVQGEQISEADLEPFKAHGAENEIFQLQERA